MKLTRRRKVIAGLVLVALLATVGGVIIDVALTPMPSTPSLLSQIEQGFTESQVIAVMGPPTIPSTMLKGHKLDSWQIQGNWLYVLYGEDGLVVDQFSYAQIHGRTSILRRVLGWLGF